MVSDDLTQTQRATMKRHQADDAGVKAIDFLAGAPDLLNGFLNVSGLSPDDLLCGHEDKSIRLNALHYIAADEGVAKAFCESAGLKPGQLGQILAALDPHGSTAW
jgi:hypothetical protein